MTTLDIIIVTGLCLLAWAVVKAEKPASQPRPGLLGLGQIGRNVAVINMIGSYFRFQVEGYSGVVKKGTLIGIINPDGDFATYEVVKDSKRIDDTTIQIDAKVHPRG